MNGIGWITVAEAARLCGTDELRITLWMNGNHIAYARFDGILMIDGASIAALFSRNRVATIYEDVAQQRGKPGRPGRLRRLLDTPLDAFVVRKEPKDHGRGRQIEGADVKGKRVVVLEDTSTTGQSALKAVEALRKEGAEIVAVAVIVDRKTGAQAAIEAEGLEWRAAFDLDDLGLDPQ